MRAAAAVALCACVLAAGCGGGDETAPTSSAPPAGAQSPERSAGSAGARLWFTSGEQFDTVGRGLPRRDSAIKPAVRALLRGPTAAERRGRVETRTQIPEGVSLENLEVEGDGTAVVRLSPGFLSGIPRRSSSRSAAERQRLAARLGQVTYTVTQFPEVDSAKVVSGGVVVNPDLTRSDYAKPERGPRPVGRAAGPRLPGTRAIQTRLAELGYLPKNAIDGVAGYQTQQAVIAFQSWSGLDRDGVVGPITAVALRTAHRPRPRSGGPARRIEVYRDRGVALLIRDRRTKRAIHVSTGGPATPTPAGRYSVFRKELRSWSVPFSTWLPYASYFNQGIAFHEYPDVPPYPASHGCVRVPSPDARRVYEFARVGTVVVVI